MKALKKIIAVRHGEYGGDGGLNDLGVEQIDRLSVVIKEHINGSGNVVLISSPLKRAVETSAILQKNLGVEDMKVIEMLAEDEHYTGADCVGQMDTLVSDDATVLIVVTHFEAPSGVIHGFSEKLGRRYGCQEIKKGSAIVLCMESGNISRIR